MKKQRSGKSEQDQAQVAARWHWRGDTAIESDVAMALAHLDDPDGAEYRKSIEPLRRHAALLAEVASAEVEEFSYAVRWSMNYILADLQAPEAIDGLIKGATREIPELDPKSEGCLRAEDEEAVVAVMAVEAIERLSRPDSDLAEQALRSVIREQSNTAVRRAAVHALLRIAPESRDQIASYLSEKQQFIVKRQTLSPALIDARPDPTRRVKATGRSGGSPRLPEDSAAPRVSERS